MLQKDPRSQRTTSTDYTTDHYSIEGCTASLSVHPFGYALEVRGPQGQPMESYTAGKTLPEALQLLERWALGYVGDNRKKEYQSCVIV